MRIDKSGLRKFAKSQGLKDFRSVARALGVKPRGLNALCGGVCRFGYETAREFYNRYGEDNLRLIVEFDKEEGETMETFKAKYVSLGNELW